MTIKRRFLISYLSAICLTLGSVFLILSLAFYVTLGKVPSIPAIYKMMTNQRELTPNEEASYLALDHFLKKSPDHLLAPFNQELVDTIARIEGADLEVVIRKNQSVPYYSADLVEKSLLVHALPYEMNNFVPTGTLDNAGRLYHYVKSDFRYSDGSSGSFIILKRESNLFEFFTRWGIWFVSLIISVAILAAWLINLRLTQTTIEPLEELEKAAHSFNQKADSQPELAVTHGNNLSQEVEQLQLSFTQMWSDLRLAEAQRHRYEDNRNQLLANLSHDLKTPITSIIGYVEGLLDGVANTPEKQQHYLETIHKKGINLNELIEQLFLYSRLENDDIVFSMEDTDFTDYLQRLVVEYQNTPQTLIDTTLPDGPLYAKVDPLQMRRVLVNLIENSLKFRNPEKKMLQLSFTLAQENEELVLTLSDNGIGIAADEIASVFTRFYRVEKSRTPTIKGSGLGLSIVKQIVEYHQGSIKLSSQKNSGTTVTLRLPLMKAGK